MKVGSTKVCDVCGETERVISLHIYLVYRLERCQIPVQHICENCILVMPQFAKLAGELTGDAPTLAQQFSEVSPRRRLAFFALADVLKAAWCRFRGASS